LKIRQELNIGEIFQYVISPLKNRRHLHVDVRGQSFNFVKCIICDSLKDLISKLRKNSDGAKEHEMKL
jgi:hypothetical protein